MTILKVNCIFNYRYLNIVELRKSLCSPLVLPSTFKYCGEDSSISTMNDPKSQTLLDGAGQQIPSASQQQTAKRPHKAKRTLAQRRFTRAEQFLSEVLNKNVNDVPKSLIEQRYNDLKQIWIEFQVAHDEYIVIDL